MYKQFQIAKCVSEKSLKRCQEVHQVIRVVGGQFGSMLRQLWESERGYGGINCNKKLFEVHKLNPSIKKKQNHHKVFFLFHINKNHWQH